MHSILKWIGTWDWGNVADWFAALGTIAAIVASVLITRYQIINDRKASKDLFLLQEESRMLDEVSKSILIVQALINSVSKSITEIKNAQNDVSIDDAHKLYADINYLIEPMENAIDIINSKLYESARTRQNYTNINMDPMRKFLGSWTKFKLQLSKFEVELSNSNGEKIINIDSLCKTHSNFFAQLNHLEESIIQKKAEIRN